MDDHCRRPVDRMNDHCRRPSCRMEDHCRRPSYRKDDHCRRPFHRMDDHCRRPSYRLDVNYRRPSYRTLPFHCCVCIWSFSMVIFVFRQISHKKVFFNSIHIKRRVSTVVIFPLGRQLTDTMSPHARNTSPGTPSLGELICSTRLPTWSSRRKGNASTPSPAQIAPSPVHHRLRAESSSVRIRPRK